MKKPVFIHHRINEIARIGEIQPGAGAEIDLRSDVTAPGNIHLSHDPWKRGDDFDAWLAAYSRSTAAGPLILNTKEDGLESRALELLKKHSVSNYFFLDTTVPTLVRWSLREGNPNFALRVSKHEPASALTSFQGKVNWVWIDCFDGTVPSAELLDALPSGFRRCLVSPELQGRDVSEITRFAPLARNLDAICTKRPDLWEREI